MSNCPECGQPAQVWADNSGGVTVNYACDNPECESGKGPWDTPRPTDDPAPVHYHWGQNIPGYLPMADEPNVTADWTAARDALLEDLDRATDAEAYYFYSGDHEGSYEGSRLASFHAADAKIRAADEGDDIYVNVASDGPHDLGVSYWVTACGEEECEVDDDGDDDHEAGRATYLSAVILLIIAGVFAAMVGHMVNAYVGMVG